MTTRCPDRGAFTGNLTPPAHRLHGQLAAAPLAPILLASGYLVIPAIPAPALWVGAARVALAGLVLVALWPARPTGRWWWKAPIAGLASLGGTFVLQAVAVQHLGAPLTATLVSCTVLINTGRAVARREEPASTIALTMTAVAGLAVAMTYTPHPAGTHVDVIGVLAAAGAAVCLAAGKELTRRWGRPPGVRAVTVTAWQLCGASLVLVPLAFLVEGPPPALGHTAVLLLGWLAVAATAAAYAVQLGGLAHGLPAAVVSRLAMLTPVLTTVLSWWVQHRAPDLVETMALLSVCGCILGGVILTHPTTPTAPTSPLSMRGRHRKVTR